MTKTYPIQDVDVDVFIALCEFAYTRDYINSVTKVSQLQFIKEVRFAHNDSDNDSVFKNMTDRASEALLVQAEPEPVDDAGPALVEANYEAVTPRLKMEENGDWFSPQKKGKKKSKKSKSTGRFDEEDDFYSARMSAWHGYPNSASKQLWTTFNSLLSKPRDPAGSKASGASSTIILFHAKIWVLAQKYLASSLQACCLRYLHAELCAYDLNIETSDGILELLNYTYDHVDTSSDIAEHRRGPGRDGLRRVVTHYASSKVEILAKNKRFREVIAGHGDMGVDLVLRLTKGD